MKCKASDIFRVSGKYKVWKKYEIQRWKK